MKTKNINYTQKLLAVLIIAAGLVSIAWINPTNVKAESKPIAKAVIPSSIAPVIAATVRDTVPAKQQKQQAEKEDAENYNMNGNVNVNMDAAKIGMEAASAAMEKIDWEKINSEVSKAMKNVDWNKLNKEVSIAMKNIDWNKINAEIKEGMKGQDAVDPKVISESVRIGMEAAKNAMANFSAEDIKNSMAVAHAAMNSPEVKEAMATARMEMQNAKTMMASTQKQMTMTMTNGDATKGVQKKYKLMLEKMTADKLIDPEKGYIITKKNGVITVNGNILSDEDADKYAEALDDAKDVAITGKKDNLSISINED